MKKVLLVLSLVGVATSAMANVQVVNEGGYTSFTSPRTGVTYSLENPNQAEIIFKAQEIQAATPENAQRIMASNPALSPESQEQARQKLAQESQAQALVATVQSN